MRRLTTIFTIICVVLATSVKSENNNKKEQNKEQSFSTMNDWRKGIWNRDVKENLLIINCEAMPQISKAYKNTTPIGCGLTFGFEHKTRPSIIHGKGSFGFGGFVGVSRYFGKDIKITASGSHNEKNFDKYKSFTYIPVMLSANIYYNFSHSNIFMGIQAGCNIMLGQKDCHLKDGGIPRKINDTTIVIDNSDNIISIQKDDNKVSLTRVIPTGRALIGYMYEFNQDFRIRFQAGVEYQMKYNDEFKGYSDNSGYLDIYHKGEQPANICPFVSIGMVYSL